MTDSVKPWIIPSPGSKKGSWRLRGFRQSSRIWKNGEPPEMPRNRRHSDFSGIPYMEAAHIGLKMMFIGCGRMDRK